MATLNPGRQNAITVAVLLVIQMLIMSGSARGTATSARLERWLMWVSSPVVRLAEAVGGVVGGTGGALHELLAARGRTIVLEADVRRLSEELQRLREAEAENRALRQLLLVREALAPTAVAASVVTSNLSAQTRMIVIDRGRADGVRADLPVIAWGGAVGRVLMAGRQQSKVRLLTDANSGVGGLVQRSREQGIVFGRSDVVLELRFVPRFADVVHGDRVVTSGMDGIFPRGFGVGTVTSIRQDPDGTQTIELRPELDYGRLEKVLVIVEPPIEPDSAEEAGE